MIRGERGRLVVGCAGWVTLSLAACSDGVTCGPGTVNRDGVCLPNAQAGSGGGATTGGTGASTGTAGGGGAGGEGAGGPVDPGYPDFATVDVLSVAIRTGSGPFDGTDANGLSLCLNATECFPSTPPTSTTSGSARSTSTISRESPCRGRRWIASSSAA